MSVIRDERVEVLEYLQQSVQHMRETAQTRPDKSRAEMLETADRIAEDRAKLEGRMIETLMSDRNEAACFMRESAKELRVIASLQSFLEPKLRKMARELDERAYRLESAAIKEVA